MTLAGIAQLERIMLRFEGLDFDRVYYADDTLVITTCTQACNDLVHEIEKVSAQFGVRLSTDTMFLYCDERFNSIIKFCRWHTIEKC